MNKAWKGVVSYFDKLEDRVRFRLSRKPILYAIIGAIGVALIWKGVDDIANSVGITGFIAFAVGLVLLLMTGLMVSFFIGDTIIISGLQKQKKIVDKTEADLVEEESKVTRISSELKHIERELEDLKKHSQTPHIRL